MKTTLHSPLDQTLISLDVALRTLFAKPRATRPTPQPPAPQPSVNSSSANANQSNSNALSQAQIRHSAGLMRVNHVGEICAQALYAAQALTATQPEIRAQLQRAAQEEIDHLAWTAERLEQLQSHPSRLNPLWYAGAFGLGLLAGRCGNAISLGFVVETEAQVEAHLASHLQHNDEGLPVADTPSRAIVLQMQIDEAAHGQMAKQAGGAELPNGIKWLMKKAARVMTKTAYWV